MNKYKIGDIVLFSLDSENKEIKLYSEVGVVLSINEDVISIFSVKGYSTYMHKIDVSMVRPVTEKENTIQEITQSYNNEIRKHELLLKSVRRSDYKDEIINKYYDLKTEIINTARNLVELDSENDTDFENKLKAICQKKKELFAIECEETNEARIYNGKIKYYITELNSKRDKLIKGLDDNIIKLKEELGMEE